MSTTKTKGLDEKFCSDCGEVIKAKAEICPKCGVRQMAAPTAGGKRNKVVAGLLAIFLGGIGAQYFYLGFTGSGIACLLFFWSGIPEIIGFVHGIYLLAISDEKFDEVYNKNN